ncbi:MAG TPA: cytidylate kinase-like family protein [Dehalococcoidia bacterium]|nr:cytidylate kinase-like family protein [Dehalococcoidia bacterium]
MTASVITFTVQLGTGGPSIARAVADKLGYRFYDSEITSQAAALVGVSPDTMANAERRPSFIERMLERLALATVVSDGIVPGSASANPAALTMTSADYRQIIERVVTELATIGDCVIVGHAGQVILRKRKTGVLKVFVHGSQTRRAERLATAASISRNEAQSLIRESDNQRAAFFKDAYDIDWIDSNLYDLTLNTDDVEEDTAVQLVMTSAGAVPDVAASAT